MKILKKEIAPELKEKADKFKNDGNELMKQEKFTEALDQYKNAIDIDPNNAVYYCNRAAGNKVLYYHIAFRFQILKHFYNFAAYSKLSDFINSIEDCKNALKIDPSYGKAWGRLG